MPARNEVLAVHFICCAGIAAVYVDAAGPIGAAAGAGIVCPPRPRHVLLHAGQSRQGRDARRGEDARRIGAGLARWRPSERPRLIGA
jgi:hypothetical protein